MKRLPGSTWQAVLLSMALGASGSRAGSEEIVLRSDRISLAVDSARGTIVRIRDSASGLVLQPPQGMAENFRLDLLNQDKTRSAILGRDQRLTSSRLDGTDLSLSWGRPLKDTAGAEHDLEVRMDVEAAGRFLTFSLHIENRSPAKLEGARYPLVGGLTRFAAPGKAADASLWIPTSTPWERPVALPFADAAFGYPGQMSMAFGSIQSRSAGTSLYFASQDAVARYKVFDFHAAPAPPGEDVFFCVRHSPFTPTGKSFDGSPVVIGFVDGDWRAAGRVYREWFQKAFGIAAPSGDWIRRQSFFLMTMFMLPEGTINFRFKDIPEWARSARDHGIASVQVSGWQVGGHDNGYPDYTIDPRLGTWEELEDGIRACHDLGLKVYFFVNYQPMMVESEWYKAELSNYREMKADGGPTWMAGWGMGTLWARMGHPKLMTWADLSFPQYRRIIVDSFARLARIGADGVHVDKMFPYYAYPDGQPEPWIGFFSPRVGRSAIICARDPADRKLTIRLELIPASSGTVRDDGNWPRPGELRGLPIGVELSFVDHTGRPGRQVYEAAPVFLRFLDGGGAEMWKAGAAGRASSGPEAPRPEK